MMLKETGNVFSNSEKGSRYRVFVITEQLSSAANTMKNKKEEIQNLEAELREYQDSGIRLLLEGRESSPASIADACAVAEHGTYMRDYIQDKSGKLNEIDFNFISEAE